MIEALFTWQARQEAMPSECRRTCVWQSCWQLHCQHGTARRAAPRLGRCRKLTQMLL